MEVLVVVMGVAKERKVVVVNGEVQTAAAASTCSTGSSWQIDACTARLLRTWEIEICCFARLRASSLIQRHQGPRAWAARRGGFSQLSRTVWMRVSASEQSLRRKTTLRE